MSLSARIAKYLYQWKEKDPEKWISGIEIERLTLEIGYKASNGSRRCRELVNDKVLEVRYNSQGNAEYRRI